VAPGASSDTGAVGQGAAAEPWTETGWPAAPTAPTALATDAEADGLDDDLYDDLVAVLPETDQIDTASILGASPAAPPSYQVEAPSPIIAKAASETRPDPVRALSAGAKVGLVAGIVAAIGAVVVGIILVLTGGRSGAVPAGAPVGDPPPVIVAQAARP
jgi:hypothetical protein